MAATGGVLLSLLLTWYSVTITAVGMQFYQSLERALLYRLFPAAASGVGGLSGPLTISVSALSKEAGGWRWAILVVSIVLILEVLLAIGSGVASRPRLAGHTQRSLLALCVVNLVLVGAAFFNLPYSDVPSSYTRYHMASGRIWAWLRHWSRLAAQWPGSSGAPPAKAEKRSRSAPSLLPRAELSEKEKEPV